MIDYSKLPKPSFSTITITVALGVIVAIGLYQAQIRGFFPSFNLQIPKTVNIETKTIVQEENAVISVVDKTSESVVAIGVSRKVINPSDPFSQPKSEDSTIGTGFVVSDKGIIVTNKHVLSGEERFMVVTRDGQKYEVQKIYRDPILDLAIVQINAAGLKPLELGNSTKLKVGQTVIVIGNALGRFTNTVTTGVVSGLGRQVVAGDPFEGSVESLDDLIQTDAAINLGNSGGPLLNSAGQVIGVSVATTEGAQNIGFAIPINSVRKIVDEFIVKGSVTRPFLGVKYKFIDQDLAISNEVPEGAYVQEVISGSSADVAGVKAGDIITKIDGINVDSESKIGEVISPKNIGDRLTLILWNGGNERLVTAILQELPSQ